MKFLGYGFRFTGRRIIPTIHAKSRARLKDSVREILRRNRHRGLEGIKRELKMMLRGWAEYFKLTRNGSWIKDIDSWIRRRIRQLLWKVWKKTATKFKALRKLGCSRERAWEWANTRKSYWHTANSPVLAMTLKNDVLKANGWTWLGLYLKPMEWSS